MANYLTVNDQVLKFLSLEEELVEVDCLTHEFDVIDSFLELMICTFQQLLHIMGLVILVSRH
jgi:hypothetical protein